MQPARWRANFLTATSRPTPTKTRRRSRGSPRCFPTRGAISTSTRRRGLTGPRSVFGHCIHLQDSEVAALAESRSVAAFCPTSNLFLGSGLFDQARLKRAGVRIALATDVGGGTSYSMLRTAAEGYKVLQLNGQSWPALEAFYRMTLGNARALSLDDRDRLDRSPARKPTSSRLIHARRRRSRTGWRRPAAISRSNSSPSSRSATIGRCARPMSRASRARAERLLLR